MDISRKQVIGGVAGLTIAAVGSGLLLGDFARTDNFAYYKQPHASSYQSPGALAEAEAPAAPVGPVPVAQPTPLASPTVRVSRHNGLPIDPEIVVQQVDESSDEPELRENPEQDAEGEE